MPCVADGLCSFLRRRHRSQSLRRSRDVAVRHGTYAEWAATQQSTQCWLPVMARKIRHEHHRRNGGWGGPRPVSARTRQGGWSATGRGIGVRAGKGANATPMTAVFALRMSGGDMQQRRPAGLHVAGALSARTFGRHEGPWQSFADRGCPRETGGRQGGRCVSTEDRSTPPGRRVGPPATPWGSCCSVPPVGRAPTHRPRVRAATAALLRGAAPLPVPPSRALGACSSRRARAVHQRGDE